VRDVRGEAPPGQTPRPLPGRLGRARRDRFRDGRPGSGEPGPGDLPLPGGPALRRRRRAPGPHSHGIPAGGGARRLHLETALQFIDQSSPLTYIRAGGRMPTRPRKPTDPPEPERPGKDEEEPIEILEVVGVDETTGAVKEKTGREERPAGRAGGRSHPDTSTLARELEESKRDKDKYYDLLL